MTDSSNATLHKSGSPGSHPHADRPNWQPATTIDEYLRNCREGLEEYSHRRATKLLGMTRMATWRAVWVAKLPEELVNRLLRKPGRKPSMKTLADVARAMIGRNTAEVECCPHCGGLLRVRELPADVRAIVNEWIDEQDEAR
jgi:hypothetical protein